MAAPTRSETEQRDAVYWADIRRRVTESRAAQGLPPTVTNPDVLRLVAAAIRTAHGKGTTR